MEHADDLLAEDPQTTDQPRRSLRRKLVENPLVRREDLTDAERDVLSRERTAAAASRAGSGPRTVVPPLDQGEHQHP